MPPAYALSGGIYFAQKPFRHAVNWLFVNGLAFVIHISNNKNTCGDSSMTEQLAFQLVDGGLIPISPLHTKETNEQST